MTETKGRKHTDGSYCPEGTQRIPSRYTPCCDDFLAHTFACYFDIRYEWWPRLRGWFIVIDPSAGGGGVAISHCPHCGGKLSGVARSGRYIEIRELHD